LESVLTNYFLGIALGLENFAYLTWW